MTDIHGNCPHCKEKVKLDLDKLDGGIQKAQNSDIENVTQTQSTIQQQKPQDPEIKEVIKTVTPQDEPFFVCKNGNCGDGVHRNENYSKKPNKKCKNCDSLNGNKKCKNCGNIDEEEFDELEDEDLKELGIPMPGIDEHEEHHHE